MVNEDSFASFATVRVLFCMCLGVISFLFLAARYMRWSVCFLQTVAVRTTDLLKKSSFNNSTSGK